VSFSAHLVTVSSSRTAAADRTGPALAAQVAQLGGTVTGTIVTPDDRETLQAEARRVAGTVDVLVLAGGTGVAPSDITPEALRPLLDRELPGLGELMRARGAANPKVGARAYLSRSFAGILQGTLVLGVPGSPGGATDSLAAVGELIPHVVQLCRGQVRDCQAELEDGA
jgi:molybdenum cofactor synthesis domain-containing protein